MVMIRCPAFEVQAFAGIDKLRVALHFWVFNLGTRVVVLNGDNSASTGAARAALMR